MLIVNKEYETLDTIVGSDTVYESTMTNSDYVKHSYAADVISKLLSDEPIRLGPNGEYDVFYGSSLTSDEKAALSDILSDITNTTVSDFNNAIKATGLQWGDIFKGDFSGYKAGLSSKNRGNAFEDEFISDFDKYEPELREIAKYKSVTGTPRKDAEKNQKRPLTFSNGKITCGSGEDFNIGHTVTDITVPVTACKAAPNGELYLSLKFGDTVSFVNSGISKLFPKEFFTGGGTLSDNAKALLNMLNIDEDAFRDVFNSYIGTDKSRKTQKNIVNITDKLKTNPLFKTFMKSVMGYGYILVHKNKNGNIDYLDLTDERALDRFIADIKSAYVLYPKDGTAKRVDVLVDYPGISFKIALRNTRSGIYPSHITALYNFK